MSPVIRRPIKLLTRFSSIVRPQAAPAKLIALLMHADCSLPSLALSAKWSILTLERVPGLYPVKFLCFYY